MTPSVLFVSHASRSGAPLMLLNFLRWLRTNTDMEFSILVKSGELAAEFAEVAPTQHVNPPDAGAGARLVRRVGSPGGAFAPLSGDLGGLERLIRSTARRVASLELRHRAHIGSANLVYLNSITSAVVLPLVPSDVRVITHVHELGHTVRVARRQDPGTIAQMVRRTDRFIAASQCTADELAAELDLDPGRIDVCHEFIPTDVPLVDPGERARLRAALGLVEGTLVVGSVGRIEWRKGADLFIQVAKRTRELVGPDRDVAFVWIGPPTDDRWLEYVRHDVRALGLENQIRFVGPMDNAQRMMAAFDVFALTSRSDPYPLVCLEAAAMGRPIVCFDAGGMSEFLEEADGLVVPYLDTEAMARRIADLLASPSEAGAIGERLARRVRQRHRLESVAPVLLERIRHTMADS